MRHASEATRRKLIATAPDQTTQNRWPAWLRVAVSDALLCRSMSTERERRMLDALGIAPAPRQRYWRMCLPAELTPGQRQRVREAVQVVLAEMETDQ